MIKLTIITSFFWKLFEKFTVQIIQLTTQIILTRYLLPRDFGLITIVLVFINISQVFINGGLNKSLIQKKEINQDDISSAFLISTFFSVIFVTILFLISKPISDFYKLNELDKIIKVLSLSLLFMPYTSVQVALLQREMKFRKLFIAVLITSLLSGFTGIYFAIIGYGVWSIVIQQFSASFLLLVILLILEKLNLNFIFSTKSIKEIFGFGFKIFLSNLFLELYRDLRSLVIGRVFTGDQLGFFNRGQIYPKVLGSTIDSTLQNVMFPVYSKNQGNIKNLKYMVRQTMMISAFFVFPLMTGFAILAKNFVNIFLTPVWMPIVPILQIYSIVYAFIPIQTANKEAILAIGRSDVFFKISLIKRVVGIIILIITIPFGIYAIALGSIVSSLFDFIVNSFPNKKFINYKYSEQIKDISIYMLLSMSMGLVVYLFNNIFESLFFTTFLQIGIGFITYFGLSLLFRVNAITLIVQMIKYILNINKIGESK